MGIKYLYLFRKEVDCDGQCEDRKYWHTATNGKLCNRHYTVICPKCSVTSYNIAVHKLQYCRKNENVRLELWQSLITHMNSENILNFIQLSPEWQII